MLLLSLIIGSFFIIFHAVPWGVMYVGALFFTKVFLSLLIAFAVQLKKEYNFPPLPVNRNISAMKKKLHRSAGQLYRRLFAYVKPFWPMLLGLDRRCDHMTTI